MDATQQMDLSKEANNELVFSYLTLRNLIGFGGMLLPVVLAVLPARTSEYNGFEPSISDYFYTDRGDILVVMLCVIGTFLITYKGYTLTERALTFLAGVCGMGVAFVPTKKDCGDCGLSVHTGEGGILPSLNGTGWHFAFAAIFLLSLSFISIFYFTKTKEGEQKLKPDGRRTQKAKRNIVFITCGWIIIGSLAILGVYFIAGFDLKPFPMVYVFETVAVEAFGFAWLVKGQTLWPDGEHYLSRGIREMKQSFN
ncbi:hypothetical protein GR160_07910 [Flavobacterium sp. Sd200]|uniref:hypothetical protein n=1 Tax=Flavobacterium sp. Sd200 TaxID=2692211 RepID=UPI00136E66C2|nr:hypothetical protein [Flavobacterium sp. Sd200]MXN91154.1 hypothetical protein [Flavobacterium sp. Sd200]